MSQMWNILKTFKKYQKCIKNVEKYRKFSEPFRNEENFEKCRKLK